jgi:predicted nucleotidyltransferase
MDDSIDPNIDYVRRLGDRLGRPWVKLAEAKQSALEVQELLRGALRDFSSDDVDIVTFGSLARLEWTSGSDVDWTLLIDGQAIPEHKTIARTIRERLQDLEYRGIALPKPGAEGIFGSLAFSHDIIHHIGGQADSNRNTTQRVLLLLEASPIRTDRGNRTAVGPYERVVRGILYRYLHDDTNFRSHATNESRIPRFLLNDLVRYWRTMCVDFAYKEWEQAGSKWALRNVKLRMSRKLLFVSSLLTVFSCFQNPSLASIPAGDYISKMQEHLAKFVFATPLNILTWTLERLSLEEECRKLLHIYDGFVAKLDNTSVRDCLGSAGIGISGLES